MFEVVVIGGGPAGVTAALRARELGAGVALVERGYMGGTCTNDGCVPTRVLARAARLLRDAAQFEAYGLEGGGVPRVHLPRLLARTQTLIGEIHDKKRLCARLTEASVSLYENAGPARFVSPHEIETEHGARLRGDKFIVCAGGHARRPSFPGSDLAITHSDVWTLPAVPPRVLIVGAAATGCQLASILAAFGSRVTLLDTAPRILPGEDALVSLIVADGLRADGVTVRTGTGGVSRIEKTPGGLCAHYDDASCDADAVILTLGWPGNADSLNLQAAGVAVEKSYIPVGDTLQAEGAPHIFAAGDVTGRMMLVQSAQEEARVAAENAVLGPTRRALHSIVPHGGFTDPEYGSVGLTEEKARNKEADCVAVTVPYADLDRAVIDGRPEGAFKLVVSRATRRILGAHVAGEQAQEVVSLVAGGMSSGLTVDELAHLELAYPTFTALAGIAARAALCELDPKGGRSSYAEWEKGHHKEKDAK